MSQKLKLNLKPRYWMFIVALLSLFVSCASGSSTPKARSSYNYKQTKLANASASSTANWHPTQKNSIPVTMNPAVARWVETFNGPLRNNFGRWISRLGQYGPAIDKILDEEGVPRDLIYLAMIESGFNMRALSTAAAAGPWQFIASTGKMYGLDKGFFIDERQDFVQATRAAARHLNDLYKIYGDWYLAFAAYNAGSGKVNGAIRQSGTTDFWKLATPRSRFLRQETKDYVPKILAALQIVKNYKKYGYTEKSFGDPFEYDRVKVPDATDIHVIAQSANTSPEIIQTLNPSLVIGITPPGKECEVYIPKGAGEEFQKNYASVPPSKRVSYLQYRFARHDTLASVAKKYRVSPAEIAKINDYSLHQNPQPGDSIKIPATHNSLLALEQLATQNKSSRTLTLYTVKKGETLRMVAKNNSVPASSIAQWNHLSESSKLKPGQKIKIYQDSPTQNTYLAGVKPSGKQPHVSGIAYIVMQDEQNPVEFKSTQDDKIDLPVMVATEDNMNNNENNCEEPAIIKNVDGTVIDQNQPVESLESLDIKPTTKPQYHVVKPGENLAMIAAKYDIRTNDLKAINNLSSAQIRVNQKLKLSTITKTNNVSAQKKLVIHQVKNGETLSMLSHKYRVKISEIVKWNNLKTNQVKTNQKIKIIT